MKEKIKKHSSIIIAIVIVIAVIGLSYLGIVIYANYLVKLYETKTKELVPAAVEYVKANKEYIGENIFRKLDKHEKVTDGLVYVNKNQEVALAIIYDDSVCFVKKYDSDELIDLFSPKACKTYLLLHIKDYKEDINVNPDWDDNEGNDNDNLPEDNETENDDSNDNTNNDQVLVDKEDLSHLSKEGQKLYKKYIKYYYEVGYEWDGGIVPAIETNNYKNININDSSSDEYLIKYAIYNILKDNKVNIEDYEFDMDDSDDWGKYYRNGYKITTSQIEKYIKNNFKINRTIDFKNTEIAFTCNSNVAYHYFENEGYYKLVAANSIPASGCGGEDVYSKVTKEEVSGDNIYLYTEYFLAAEITGPYCYSNIAENVNSCQFYFEYSEVKPDPITFILENHSDKIGKFKHTFTKNSDGNYYWVSTQKIN